MKVRFVTQPFDDGEDLRDFLAAAAADAAYETLRMVVAWAKRSGLSRARADLRAIQERGGHIYAIVGVSEGGATEQGLKQLHDLVDEAHVFHDQGRTFHPKVYLVDCAGKAMLLVGSNNLTAGGLAWNYEASLWIDLDLSDSDDLQLRDDVVAWFERLKSDADVCVPLESDTLTAMLADKRLVIQNEDQRRRPKSDAADAPEEADSAEAADDPEAEAETPPVFGKSSIKKRKAPGLPSKAPAKKPASKPAPASGSVPGTPEDLDVTRRWYKQLDHTAAQQKLGPNSNVTGNLRLSQEDFAIDHRKYFRNEFFGGLDWRPSDTSADTEEVWVTFQVVVDGDFLGDVNLRISHAEKRISGQGNVPTLLHWGDLGPRMRGNDYRNKFISLERASGGKFALTISDHPTGQFEY